MGVKTRTNEYPYIVKWGKMMGSSLAYIQRQVQQAREDNAPKTAIYKRDNEWSVLEDVKSPQVFKDMGLSVPDNLKRGVTIVVSASFPTDEEREVFEADVFQRLSGVDGIRVSYTNFD